MSFKDFFQGSGAQMSRLAHRVSQKLRHRKLRPQTPKPQTSDPSIFFEEKFKLVSILVT